MEKKKYEKPLISREQLEKELLQANERLWTANQKLKQEEQARMVLFANLSHDLRSPMAALLSSIEYLKVNVDETDLGKMEILELMERRLCSMQTLINDMFLLTKLESSSLEMHLVDMDAVAFLEEFFYEREADPMYENRELILQISDSLKANIMIDPQMLIRVLDNLFSNALKYSEKGATISLSAEICGEELFITVRDTGIGISEDNLPFIFERSYRVTRSRTPGDDSSGLGLSIAKGLMEQMQGRIVCTSKEGVGSCFQVILPCRH